MKQILASLFFISLMLSSSVYGSSVDALTLKANFVVKFIPFIEFPIKLKEYRVGFIGKPERFKEFGQAFEGKSHAKVKFVVTNLDSKSDLSKVDILFIDANQFPPHLTNVMALIISDEENGLEKGAIINFQMADELIKFEINQLKSLEYGYKISSRLLNLAKRVVQ